MSQQDLGVVLIVVPYDHEAFTEICQNGRYFGTKDDSFVFTPTTQLDIEKLRFSRVYGGRLRIKDDEFRVQIVELDKRLDFL